MRQKRAKFVPVIAVYTSLLLTASTMPVSSHSFYSQWRTADGMSCCNQSDCRPVEAIDMSTHALMRAAVLQLARWSLLTPLQSKGTPPIGITTFHYGPESVPVAIKPEHGVHHLYAPRRTILDRILVDAAEVASAEVHHGENARCATSVC